MDTLARGYSQLGVEHLSALARWIVPEGHPLLRDTVPFKWWHLILVCVLYPLVIGNVRSYRAKRHPQPVKSLRLASFVFTGGSLLAFLYILYEIGVYFVATGVFWTCHAAPCIGAACAASSGAGMAAAFAVETRPEVAPTDSWFSFVTGAFAAPTPDFEPLPSAESVCGPEGCAPPPAPPPGRFARTIVRKRTPEERGVGKVIHDRGKVEPPSSDMGFVLWLFHITRAAFDFFVNFQNTLTKPVEELKTPQSVNEIRFSLSHLVLWHLILLYEPGGEVMYSIATVCLFYIGTIACAVSQDRFIDLKMGLWLVIVLSNFARHGANLWSGCRFPAALLAVSPPFDINDPIHMFWFYSWFGGLLPIGGILSYFIYGGGASCTWFSVVQFFLLAQWQHKGNTEGTIGLEIKSDPQPEVAGSEGPEVSATGSAAAEKSSPNSDGKDGKPVRKVGQLQLRKCAFVECNVWESQVREFNVCQRCRTPYCSRPCQERDWSEGRHRLYCRLIRKRKLALIAGGTLVGAPQIAKWSEAKDGGTQ